DARLRSKIPMVCLIKQRELYLVWRSSGIKVGTLSQDYDVEKNGSRKVIMLHMMALLTTEAVYMPLTKAVKEAI
nr:hypothetical protein [Tanacetum cinerariifolium]